MNITVIGTGYVGLVSGACLSELGAHVTCVDLDEGKVERLKQGIMPIYEPGLEDIVVTNHEAGKLDFTTDTGAAVAKSDAVFIAVGTPQADGQAEADMSYVYGAAKGIAPHLKGYTVIIDKSTVPVGTARRVAEIIRAENPNADFDVASNPEFLREGSAVGDFMRPDRVVLGADTERAMTVLRRIYRPLALTGVPVEECNPETAEMAKYASNSFLAAKITFINQVADLCEKSGADVEDVARSMGLDKRIGPMFLKAGPGYGGSCFPKDTNAFAVIGRRNGSPQHLVEAVITANEDRKRRMCERIVEACGGSVEGKTIAVLGLTFKPDTDDVRDSPALTIVSKLHEMGARVKAHDPMGAEHAQAIFGKQAAEICDEPYACATGADAVAVVTDWAHFKTLDLKRLAATVRGKVVVDMRNIWDADEAIANGFDYHCIGRAPRFAAREQAAPLRRAAE
ncbi:UDP-glucose dehydrogenase [Caenispirillum salinarum AK4]|uniref:UDP-glucose 6-dehydrogenase n=1 Tax=Caenispirillum salinarum AK4 TaxID=1238182 RepID=K9HQS7_9PROT|nr:UDP-glucose/GDP-mannose dehydrogenase family protein [Caenispirillum salinarum]EKV30786.1 UDP-glucose dehydrogenase [Caenispirillum salinarum AK4]